MAAQEWSSGMTRERGLRGSTLGKVTSVVTNLEKISSQFFPPPCLSAQVQAQSPRESDLAWLGISQEFWTEQGVERERDRQRGRGRRRENACVHGSWNLNRVRRKVRTVGKGGDGL